LFIVGNNDKFIIEFSLDNSQENIAIDFEEDGIN